MLIDQNMFSQAMPLVIVDCLFAFCVAGFVRQSAWRVSLWLSAALLSAPIYYCVPGYFSSTHNEYVLWAPLFLRPFLLFAYLATMAGAAFGHFAVRFLRGPHPA